MAKRQLENKYQRDSFATDKAVLPSSVFGVLAEIGSMKIKHYWSDLYHDAMELKELLGTGFELPNVGDSLSFYWSCGDCGTHLMKDDDYYKTVRKQRGSDSYYLVTLRQEHKYEKYSLRVDWIMLDDLA